MDLVSLYEKLQVCCFNSRDCIEICTDKFRTALKLAEFGLKQPKQSLVHDKDDVLKSFYLNSFNLKWIL